MKRWPVKPLRAVLEISRERVEPAESPSTHFNYIGLETIEGHTGRLMPYGPTLGSEIKSTKNVFRAGEVLYGKLRPNLNKVHLANEDGICSTDIFVLRPTSAEISSSYCAHYLRSPAVLESVTNAMAGANLPRIGQDAFLEIPIPVPPLAEQERIVKLLDEADALRKLRAQAGRRTAALLPALFDETFKSSKYVENTIGQFLDQSWLVLHKDGNHGSLYPRASDFGDEGVPFLSATCVMDEGTIDHTAVKRLAAGKAQLLRHGWIERGDVLLAHNASVGAVGFYEGDYERAIIGTSLTTFRVNPEHIDSRFLWAALRDRFFQQQLERIMKQALRNQVPITAQRDLFLRIPPLPLQQTFARRVGEIRELEAAQAASRRRLDALFASLLHRAFAGELVQQDPAEAAAEPLLTRIQARSHPTLPTGDRKIHRPEDYFIFLVFAALHVEGGRITLARMVRIVSLLADKEAAAGHFKTIDTSLARTWLAGFNQPMPVERFKAVFRLMRERDMVDFRLDGDAPTLFARLGEKMPRDPWVDFDATLALRVVHELPTLILPEARTRWEEAIITAFPLSA